MTEIEKYRKIYGEKTINGYGFSNCGNGFLPFLLEKQPVSVVDIGCGHNCFVKNIRRKVTGIKAVGIDFACESADLICDANKLPFKDKEFEWVTSFDALEHLQEAEVSCVLAEMKRVSSKFAFSICYRDSVYKVDGETLHPTVRPESWWVKKIEEAGAIVKKHGRYLYGEWVERRLTIGMVVYDDFDGFYFTIQAMRMYHSEAMNSVKFVVINTNPSSQSGKALKKFCEGRNVSEPLTYIEDDNSMGTATRSKIFDVATTPFVMVVDPHILIESGGIKKLIDFFDSGKDCGNLLQAPLLCEDLKGGPCKFEPIWRNGMLGIWQTDERSAGKDVFEIPAQGLGLFACRKDSWLGFAKNHSGFGSEECTVNERFRQAGKQTLCLPWLKWLHRFNRPNGVPYRNNYEDRIKNYFRSYIELDQPVFEIFEHYKTLGVSEEKMREWLGQVLVENV